MIDKDLLIDNKDILVEKEVFLCGSIWCVRCRKILARNKISPRLVLMSPLWMNARKLSVTVDPKRFNGVLTLETYLQLQKEKSDHEEKLKKKLGKKYLSHFCWMEFQKNGFPHWHYIIWTTEKGKASMIGETVIHECFDVGGNVMVREGFFRSEKDYKESVGYFAKTGYFDKDKKYQHVLPDSLKNSGKKVRGYAFAYNYNDVVENIIKKKSTPDEYEREGLNTEKDNSQERDGEPLRNKEDERSIIDENTIWWIKENDEWKSGTLKELQIIDESIPAYPGPGAIWNQETKSYYYDDEDFEHKHCSMSIAEKIDLCGKKIRFRFRHRITGKVIGHSDWYDYDPRIDYILNSKLKYEKGRGYCFPDSIYEEKKNKKGIVIGRKLISRGVHDADDAILFIADVMRKYREETAKRKSEQYVKSKHPEMINMIQLVFPGCNASIVERKSRINITDESFAEYENYNSVEEYLNRRNRHQGELIDFPISQNKHVESMPFERHVYPEDYLNKSDTI